MFRKIAYGLLLIILIAFIFLETPISHSLPKPSAADFQITSLQSYARENSEALLKLKNVDNVSFVHVIQPRGEIWKYNDKGEVLDPWSLPYLISKKDGQICVISPGLEAYKKLPWYERMFK